VGLRAARPLESTKLADRPPDVCNQYIPGVRRVLSLHVRLPAVSQPRLPRRILRRPEKEDEASLRKPAQRENN
jgi:hypothetical protein